MPLARKGDLTATMAILGLLVERPDTVNGVKLRLTERFPSAGWSRSIAHGAMPSLVHQGFVRMIREGAGRSLDVYEAAPSGIERFRKWLSEFSAAPPVLRDALHAKLQFAADADNLIAVVRAIRGQEEACFEAAEAARIWVHRARHLGQLAPAKDADRESRLLGAMMIAEMRMWSDTAKQLKRFREDLEDLDTDEQEGRSDGGDSDG
jgi:DNA-binding PadR family transcriptional regulator